MIKNISLNCQPIRLGENNKKLSFGESTAVIVNQPQLPERAFSCINAVKEFGSGLVAPVVDIFKKGPKGIALMLATGSFIGLALRQLSSKAKALVITGFAAAGVFKIGKGLYQATANSENPEKQEKAFHTMGEGVSVTALSVAASKPALKGVPGIDTSKMSPFKAFGTCIKQTKSALKECVTTIGSLFKKGGKLQIGETAAVTTDVIDVTDLSSLLEGSVIHKADQAIGVKNLEDKIKSAMTRASEPKESKAEEAVEVIDIY